MPDPLGRLIEDPYHPAERLRRAWQEGRLDSAFRRELPNLSASVGRAAQNDREDVAKIESLLEQTGDLDLEKTEGPTGYPGLRLDTAIRSFQQRTGLKVDGTVKPGGETVRALDAQVTEPNAPPSAPQSPRPPIPGRKPERPPKTPRMQTPGGRGPRSVCIEEAEEARQRTREFLAARRDVYQAEQAINNLPDEIARLKEEEREESPFPTPLTGFPNTLRRLRKGKKYSLKDLMLDLLEVPPLVAQEYQRRLDSHQHHRRLRRRRIEELEKRLNELPAEIERLRGMEEQIENKADEAVEKLKACEAKHGQSNPDPKSRPVS